jgi:hypothetical protein
MKESTKRFTRATIDSRNRVHGEDMGAVQKIMHAFFLQDPPPGIDADTTIMWSNTLEFN